MLPWRWLGPLVVAATTLPAVVWQHNGARAAPVQQREQQPTATRSPSAAGVHWRLETEHGPVHVWHPLNWRVETAGTVIYVHGYYTNVDRAWRTHRLAEQFAASGINALFIAPAAPSGNRQQPSWPQLGELLTRVAQAIELPRPWGPLAVLGHSGGYRSIIPWLGYRDLGFIGLIDALYGEEEAFAHWLGDPAQAGGNRLVNVAIDTLRWSEPLVRRYAEALTFDLIPETFTDLDPAARSARLLYLRSQVGHMELVTDGQVIPLLLQLSGIEELP